MAPLLIPLIGKVLDSVLPDPQAQAEAKIRLLELAQKPEAQALEADVKLALAQIGVNQVEAGADAYRGGWRPFVGWVCGFGLAYQNIARPLLGWVGENVWGWSQPPSLDMETLMALLFGILGLGAYRTYERVKGKA